MSKLSVMLFLFILVGCATTSRVPLHKIVGSPTIRIKVVLLETDKVDPVYYRPTVREFEAVLLRQPLTYALKGAVGEKVDLVLVTRRDIQTIKELTPDEILKLGRESDLHLVVVVEPLSVDYTETMDRKGDEVCAVREAGVTVSVKVAETKAGEVVLAGVYRGLSKAKQCSKEIRRTDKLPSKDILIVRALKGAASKFSKEFWSSL